ncbi:unnamed product [Ostreococcus tauri]|uniref:Unnamed product n=2 Tax=Ostreococcus tauri TaxID=70448 RepID=A0A090M5E2_OSTTA|nr:unnamed product [Ostreococcus tauri]CEF97349.1 unnamed product [Ostreococcus tauri]|eukprot:XP_003078458.2 unnamed product [Ostreococcus tauri]
MRVARCGTPKRSADVGETRTREDGRTAEANARARATDGAASTETVTGERTRKEGAVGDPGRGAVVDFVDALREDGTLRRLESAAERLREATRGGAREIDRSSSDRSTERRENAEHKLLQYLDNSDRSSNEELWRLESGIVAPTNTAIATRLSGESRSSTATSAPSIESDIDALLNFVEKSCANARELDDEPNDERTPEPMLTRSKAIRCRPTLPGISSDDDDTDSPGFTPPKKVVPSSQDSLAAVESLKGRRSSSSRSMTHDSSPSDDVNRFDRFTGTRFDDVFPALLRAQIHDALSESNIIHSSSTDNDGGPSDVWPVMLRFRLLDIPRQRLRSARPTLNATIGLCLLRSIDAEAQMLDRELSVNAIKMSAIEREVREKSMLVRRAIFEIPSERLREALVELHQLSLDLLLRQGVVRQFESQLARINTVLADPRVRRKPETASDAFDYACALGLQGHQSAGR